MGGQYNTDGTGESAKQILKGDVYQWCMCISLQIKPTLNYLIRMSSISVCLIKSLFSHCAVMALTQILQLFNPIHSFHLSTHRNAMWTLARTRTHTHTHAHTHTFTLPFKWALYPVKRASSLVPRFSCWKTSSLCRRWKILSQVIKICPFRSFHLHGHNGDMLKSASCGVVLPFSPRSDPIGCLPKKRGRAACWTKDTLCLCLSVCGPICGRYIHRSHKCLCVLYANRSTHVRLEKALHTKA